MAEERGEIPKEDIQYDEEINRLVISLPSGEEYVISPQVIREFLPTKTGEEKAKDLAMRIHDINKEKLTRMRYFITRMKELEKDLEEVRKGLKECTKPVCVKKYQVMIKSFVDSKNILAEIRRTIGLLEREKAPLRTRIAKLGFDPEELTGEKYREKR